MARILDNIWLFGLLFVTGGAAVIALFLEHTTLTCTRGAAGQGECTVACPGWVAHPCHSSGTCRSRVLEDDDGRTA